MLQSSASFLIARKARRVCWEVVRYFISGVERLVAELHPELLPRVSIILKDIYECDLVPEEVFLAWAEKPSKKYVEKTKSKQVREKADPFISWLRDASEEESDDDE